VPTSQTSPTMCTHDNSAKGTGPKRSSSHSACLPAVAERAACGVAEFRSSPSSESGSPRR
jgi:hypothetical protein